MKRMYLMKGMAALAFGLVAVSCNKSDIFNPYADQEKNQQESETAFAKNVMDGQAIDANQTWSTANAMEVSVTPSATGTLKIYTANPIGNVVAPLYTANVTAGAQTTFTVTKPADAEKLYAAVMDKNNMILDMLTFNASGSKVDVDMSMPEISSRRAVSRRSMPEQPSFRDGNDKKPVMPTIYKNTLADAKTAGATAISDGIQQGGVYYMTPGMSAPDIQNTSLTIYFDGDFTNNAVSSLYNYQNDNGTTYCVTKGSKLKITNGIRNNLKIYLAPEAELDITSINWDLTMQNGGDKTAIYMSAGSKLKVNSLIFYHGTILNEGGTITANKLKITDGALLYNNGTVDLKNVSGDGKLDLYNTNAEFVNNNTLLAKSVSLAAGSKFLNTVNGEVTVSGATDVYNESDCWMNNGLYTTGTFKCWDTKKVYNNCRLTVTGKFTMNGSDSNFILNGEASLICDSFDWNSDNAFWLGGGSLVKVAKELKSNNGNDGERGFFQFGDEYAVISAASVTTDYPNSQWRARYSGKIYVDCSNHFDFVSMNDTQKNIYIGEGVVFSTQQNAAPVNWAESKCRPAYNYKKPDPDPVMYYYYAFEDLGTTNDFDFNDVVIRVSAPNNGTSTVQLMCAGGTMSTKVTYGERTLCNEVHAAFGVDNIKDMINTGAGSEKTFPVTLGTIENLTADTDMSRLPFGITCQGNNGQVFRVENSVENHGKAPLVIVVNGYPSGDNAGKWFWSREYINIVNPYEQFGAWGANVQTNANWYLNYTERKDGKLILYKW